MPLVSATFAFTAGIKKSAGGKGHVLEQVFIDLIARSRRHRFHRNNSRFNQNFQVLGNRGLRQRKDFRDVFAATMTMLRNMAQNVYANRIGERGKDDCHIFSI